MSKVNEIRDLDIKTDIFIAKFKDGTSRRNGIIQFKNKGVAQKVIDTINGLEENDDKIFAAPLIHKDERKQQIKKKF